VSFVVGVDIGGTFTDFVVLDMKGSRIFAEKILTTPDRPADAVIHGLEKLASSHGFDNKEISRILHATTLATNAVIERKGAATGLLTTKGFEDVLDIRKGLRYNQYDLNIQVPKPYVPRYLRRGISERVLASGEIRTKMDEKDVKERAQELVNEGIESLAICFLHSYANFEHEKRAREIVHENFPKLFVSCSHEITSQAREYERSSTTVIDAYIKPLIQSYIEDLRNRLARLDFSGKLLLMTCTGGVVEIDIAESVPVLLLESGPVAGVSMAQDIAKRLSLGGVFSFDMGGTTAKGCIVKNQQIEKSYEFEAARFDKFRRGSGIPVSIPVVRLIETGSGGGSIAWLDQMGLVRVGPLSASSKPGPACYGLGGTEPTVTDADLVLGYLDEKYFVGGAMPLVPGLARSAIEEKISSPSDVTIEEAAWAIHERVNEDVAAAFRLHASEIGVDYRKYSFVPFGGAGPVHSTRIAKKLGISKVVIPPRAGVLSAEGLLVSPLSIDLALTKRTELSDLNFEKYLETFDGLIEKGLGLLSSAGVTRKTIRVARILDMCYHGQGYDVPVTLRGERTSKNEFLGLAKLFEKAYHEKYLVSRLPNSIDISSFKVTISSTALKMPYDIEEAHASRQSSIKRAFDPDTNRFRSFRVLSRYSLKKGDKIKGPALIQEVESTTVLPSKSTAGVDQFRNLVVEMLG